VLHGLPIHSHGKLRHRIGNSLDWIGVAEFGESVCDGFIERVGVDLNAVEDSV